jgi:hypothetical protein
LLYACCCFEVEYGSAWGFGGASYKRPYRLPGGSAAQFSGPTTHLPAEASQHSPGWVHLPWTGPH